MKVSISLFLLILGHCITCSAQEWKLIKSIPLKEVTTSQSIDSEGAIYIATVEGNLYRYDQAGISSEVFADIAKFPITTIETWNRLKPFVFHFGSQQFYFLDRFNTTPITYEMSDFYSGLARLSTPGMDNSIWILTSEFNELKKYNIQTRQLLLENPLLQDLSKASYMRAYHNQLYIADPQSGLYCFDQFGNELYHDNQFKAASFQISEKQLIYLEDDWVKIIDLNLRTIKAKIPSPEKGFANVLKDGNSYCFVRKNSISLYELVPEQEPK